MIASKSSMSPPCAALVWGRWSHGVRARQAGKRYRKCGYTSERRRTSPMAESPRERVAAAYKAHYEALFNVARSFRVPRADVQPIIHDVFVSYIRHIGISAIGDDRGWLITATKHACLNYRRDVKPGTPLPPEGLLDGRALRDDVAARLDLARVLRRVNSHCRKVLWRRYVDGWEPGDIAAELSKKRTYGRQIVHRCLRAAREALATFRRGRS